MIAEILSISGIIAASAALAWYAKIRYQPSIERRLSELEASNPNEVSTAPSTKFSKLTE